VKTLIACPVHICKSYALMPWIEAVCGLRPERVHHDFELLWLDNSPRHEIYDLYHKILPVGILTSPEDLPMQRIARSMEAIRWHMLYNDFSNWLSLECDVIPSPNALNEMLVNADAFNLDWLSATVPGRENDQPIRFGFGCSLFSRRFCERVKFGQEHPGQAPDAFVMKIIKELDLGLNVAELPAGVITLKHLKNPDPELEVHW